MYKLANVFLGYGIIAFIYCILVGGLIGFPWSLIVLAAFVVKKIRSRRGQLDAYGTAKWADAESLRKGGLL